MPKLILIVVGLPASGKTFVAEMIARKYGAAMVNSGDVIRREIRRRGLPYNKKTEGAVSAWFHEKGREIIVGEHAWNMIKDRKNDIYVIEGLRSYGQLKMIERHAKQKAVIIETYAPLKLRAERSAHRHRFAGTGVQYIRERDKNEKKRGVGVLLRHAKFRVSNAGTKKDLEKSIDKVMKRLVKA